MAYLYGMLGKKTLSKKFYELALKYYPHDIDLLIEYITYLESIHASYSLKIYEKVMSILESDPSIQVKPELYNNYAVTLLKNKKLEESRKQIEKALSMVDSETNMPLIVIMRYNRGVLYEEQGKFEESILEYQAVVKLNPLFQDPIMRLARIYFNKGEVQKAVDLCEYSVHN